MNRIEQSRKLSKPEQKMATKSYNDFEPLIKQIHSDSVAIEIEEIKGSISVPLKALYLLGDILKIMSQGKQ